tara:strand:- start:812 stop:2062 length:1251 start_codon:yes stop_codon:yes gene_type:complete
MVSLLQANWFNDKFKMFRAFRYLDFRLYWLSGATQSIAQGMQFLTIGILVLELTNSSLQLGLVILAYGLPNVAFSMFGGIVADRTDRLRLLISTRVAISILILGLGALQVIGLLDLWHVFAFSSLLGSVQAIAKPSRMALLADLVDRRDLMNGVSLFSMVDQSGQIIGPAFSGLIIEWFDVGTALFVNAGLYASGVLFLVFMKRLPAMPDIPKLGMLKDLKKGLYCVWSSPVLYTVIGLAFAFTFFAMSYRQVLPAFTQEVLSVGAGGTGLLWMGAGLGSLVGNLVLASLGDYKAKYLILIGSLIAVCIFLALFAWSIWYWPSWVIFFFLGMASTGFFWPMANTLIQLNAPAELRGRIISVLQVAPAIHFLSALPLAFVGETLTWPIAVTGAAGITLFFTILLGVWNPTLHRSDAG